MSSPFVSFITFNRLGLSARNLQALLKTEDDFELHIIDSNSRDDSWAYIESLSDSRIKSRTRLPLNRGPIYAVNHNLAKRKPDQYFIALDSDVLLLTPDWITKFMRVFDTFPEVGMLGVPRTSPYKEFLPPVIPMEKNGIRYLQLRDGIVGASLDFVPGHCQCLRPELINILGYWSEENYFGDAELSVRINQYTPYRAGFITDISISMEQSIPCECCPAKEFCQLDRKETTCFSIRDTYHKNESFVEKNTWKYIEYFEELKQGERSVYCASVHDPASLQGHIYNAEWAEDNFNFYVINAN
jgi:glycosyltransferase involved in cell wall biosynthesis